MGSGKFELKACGLRVSMPGDPKCSDNTENATIGRIEEHACRLTVSTKPLVVHIVACEDYPDDYVRRVHNPAGMLGASLRGEINDSHGKMLEVKDITLGSVQGREAIIDAGDAVMVLRVYIDGRRIFRFAVVGPSEIAKKDAGTLFDSIELSGPGAAR